MPWCCCCAHLLNNDGASDDIFGSGLSSRQLHSMVMVHHLQVPTGRFQFLLNQPQIAAFQSSFFLLHVQSGDFLSQYKGFKEEMNTNSASLPGPVVETQALLE